MIERNSRTYDKVIDIYRSEKGEPLSTNGKKNPLSPGGALMTLPGGHKRIKNHI